MMNWTRAAVEDRIVEAFDTLAKLPDRENRWIYGRRRHGIEYLMDKNEEMAAAVGRIGIGDKAYSDVRIRISATCAEITRMDEVFDWLPWLTNHQRKVVMEVTVMRRKGYIRISWDGIRMVLGWKCHEKTVKNHYHRGLDCIIEKIDKKNIS